jgi:hypothetical protein
VRLVVHPVAQLLVMAAIVTTALYFPLAALLALLSMALGISVAGFLTFGGSLTVLQGLLAWWGIFFVPALVYSACVMPWHASAPPR